MAIKKYSLLILSLIVIVSVFLSIPSIAKALPTSLVGVLTENSKIEESLPAVESSDDERLTSLMGEAFSAVLGYDYESEPPIPSLENLEGAEFVSAVNLCWYSEEDIPELHLINRTNFEVDLFDYTDLEFPIDNDIYSEPLVLIVHTHGTESYLPKGVNYYTSRNTFRSEKEEETVVAVGTVLADSLNSKGIITIHDTTMYDKENFSSAYSNSKAAAAATLLKYPSIKYIIDLHRDAIFTAKGVNQKPITKINEDQCAQVMLVVGTNQGGAIHPNWDDNLTVAVNLQKILNEDYPTLMRPICLRTASFNQQLSPGSILVEIGSCGNTIEEAKNAAKYFAASFAEMIYSN
ncbi:MAG: hypothetical protein A2Y15_06385 [Clostridiales bacterium GWF2_36_10]|nr:MAG: hypothetical protein A2Y15_06385 [Clostridiales bacterium GWF2_36_10]